MERQDTVGMVSKGDAMGITRGSWGHWGVQGGLWGQSSDGHSRLGGLMGFSWNRAMGLC